MLIADEDDYILLIDQYYWEKECRLFTESILDLEQ